jgi:hypothetical protein
VLFIYNGGLDPASADPNELTRRRVFVLFIVSLAPVGCLLMLTNIYFQAQADNPLIAVGVVLILSSLYIQANFNQPV